MRYRVAEIIPQIDETRANDWQYTEAFEMKQKYGLPWSEDKIIEIWNAYSNERCAQWLIPNREAIEEAFGVRLEPL